MYVCYACTHSFGMYAGTSLKASRYSDTQCILVISRAEEPRRFLRLALSHRALSTLKKHTVCKSDKRSGRRGTLRQKEHVAREGEAPSARLRHHLRRCAAPLAALARDAVRPCPAFPLVTLTLLRRLCLVLPSSFAPSTLRSFFYVLFLSCLFVYRQAIYIYVLIFFSAFLVTRPLPFCFTLSLYYSSSLSPPPLSLSLTRSPSLPLSLFLSSLSVSHVSHFPSPAVVLLCLHQRIFYLICRSVCGSPNHTPIPRHH